MIVRKWLEDWCKKHNATLINMRDEGFTYMTSNGMMWYMTYKDWLSERS